MTGKIDIRDQILCTRVPDIRILLPMQTALELIVHYTDSCPELGAETAENADLIRRTLRVIMQDVLEQVDDETGFSYCVTTEEQCDERICSIDINDTGERDSYSIIAALQTIPQVSVLRQLETFSV